MRAHIIIDLGFGDSGKGLLTDHLVRSQKAGVVIRYNGGAQAGHNVHTLDGRHHTFSQFGSGTFIPGIKTFLSKYVVIHPTALLHEGNLLLQKGVPDAFERLRISEQALVITPFHQAANRIRELVRGSQRHGSCGVGVGEAVEDARSGTREVIMAGDLHNPALLQKKLNQIRAEKWQQVIDWCRSAKGGIQLEQELDIFQQPNISDDWLASIARFRNYGLVDTSKAIQHWLSETDDLIFEGAQGVLLDEDAGFHPYTTWSHCTAVNALDLISEFSPKASIHRIGVTRCYANRHGPGPFPTETDELTGKIPDHNTMNDWQGPVRYGWFDSVLIRHALRATGGVDSLAVTHLDILPQLEDWKYCPGYREYSAIENVGVSIEKTNGLLENFSIPEDFPLYHREEFSLALGNAQPHFKLCNATDDEVIQTIEDLTGHPVYFASYGKMSSDVKNLQKSG